MISSGTDMTYTRVLSSRAVGVPVEARSAHPILGGSAFAHLLLGCPDVERPPKQRGIEDPVTYKLPGKPHTPLSRLRNCRVGFGYCCSPLLINASPACCLRLSYWCMYTVSCRRRCRSCSPISTSSSWPAKLGISQITVQSYLSSFLLCRNKTSKTFGGLVFSSKPYTLPT